MQTPEPAATPLTPAVFHVLMALSDGPLHGYAVMKRVEEESGIQMGPGTVYGSLQRLEDAGWVSAGSTDERDARRGRAFELTASGRGSLVVEARRIARLSRLVDERGLLVDTGT